eukprot:5515928-Amphidinium_carterae.1
MKLRKLTINDLGFTQSAIDRELEYRFANGRLQAAMAKHVDDCKIVCPRKVFEEVIAKTTEVFGKPEIHPTQVFQCVGVRHMLHADGSRSLDQEEFGKAIKVTDLTGAVDKN